LTFDHVSIPPPVRRTLRIRRGGRYASLGAVTARPAVAWMRMLAFSAAIANDVEAVDRA
jgi:hypothetical protein